ncbi:MAG TPA: hypothetical protein DCF73_15135 [Rhodobiaceae bacterium]|nr:hypothetical protein [Rhodobiaceae bacterium]
MDAILHVGVTKTLRQVIRLRKQDKAERQEQEAILDLYMSALGMI